MKKVIPIVLAIIFSFCLFGCEKKTAVLGIEMDIDYLNIEVGEKRIITASVLPTTAENKKIEWSSSDEDIATVKNGYVRAKKKGECKIKATTKDGSYSKTVRLVVRERALYVDKSFQKGDEGYGVWQFDTINGALAAAEEDDVIYLNSGEYREVVNITRNVQIYGDNATIIGNITLGYPTLKEYSTEVKIANITFKSDGYYPSITIGNECENVRIENCKFYGDNENHLPAVKTYESGESGAVKKIGVYDCEFYNYTNALSFNQYVVKGEIERNKFENCDFATYLEGSQMTKIYGNSLKNSGLIEFDGARVLPSGVVIEENSIEDLRQSPLIVARYGDLEKGQKLDISKNLINGVKVQDMKGEELKGLKSLIEVKNELTGEGDYEFIEFSNKKKSA